MTTPATAQEYEGHLPMTEQCVSDFRLHGRGIPSHMIGPVLRYFNDHIPPGGFLEAILSNDFFSFSLSFALSSMEACGRADEDNLAVLDVWAAFLYNEAPRIAHGSPEKVKAWLMPPFDA